MSTPRSTPFAMALAMQDTPFWLFNCAYLLFLLPVICALLLEYVGSARKAPVEVLPLSIEASESVAAAVLFLPFSVLCYVALRASIARLGWKQGEKPATQHKDDLARMAYVNVSILVLARVGKRLVRGRSSSADLCLATDNVCTGWYELAFLICVAYYTAFFSVLFEMVRFVNLQISFSVFRNPKGLWIVVVGVVVLFGVLHAHVRYAFEQGSEFGYAYLAWIVLLLVGHAAINAASPAALRAMDGRPSGSENGKSHGDKAIVHIHHWYWTFFAAHFPVFDSLLSYVSQALFLGVYLHGVACFGLEPIFEPDHSEDKTS